MPLIEDIVALGLTEYEAKVYLALLRESPATGYQLAKLSGVPRSMVYEALGRLETRGAVLKSGEERATLYRPLPPVMLVDRFESEHKHLVQGVRDEMEAIYTAPEEDRLWSISGRPAVLNYAQELLMRAGSEASLVLADRDLEALRPTIEAAATRGVAVSALLTGDDDLLVGEVARHPQRESEAQLLTDTLIVIVDETEVLIASTHAATAATVTRNRNLVAIARQFVWMELFAHRVYALMGPDLLGRLSEEDQRILERFHNADVGVDGA
jgi:sugar-specific transcriptional regulator TrmB